MHRLVRVVNIKSHRLFQTDTFKTRTGDDDVLKIDSTMQNGSQRLLTGNISRRVSGRGYFGYSTALGIRRAIVQRVDVLELPRAAREHRNERTRNSRRNLAQQATDDGALWYAAVRRCKKANSVELRFTSLGS